MAKYILAKIKVTIALAGGRAFFVPADFNRRYDINEVIPIRHKRNADDVHVELAQKLRDIRSVAILVGEVTSINGVEVSAVNGAGDLIVTLTQEVEDLVDELFHLGVAS